MNTTLRADADRIIAASIASVLPDKTVERALLGRSFNDGKVILLAVGKAAWRMANAAVNVLNRVDDGMVITKYQHIFGDIPGIRCYEAGHPTPDENGAAATQLALEMVSGLTHKDTVIFLLSGGGSALFEKPLIQLAELQDITSQLLACGADITEINTIRKRLSSVKGGRFAKACAPANVLNIILSDVLGDRPDIIASGPAAPDLTSSTEAVAIVEKYNLKLSEQIISLLELETPKSLDNVEFLITGSVSQLCAAAANECIKLGYESVILTDTLSCEANDAGKYLSDILISNFRSGCKKAYIAGGETVVHLTGNGMGGRNQQLVLAAAESISNLPNCAIFSVGSDGTDGPTDAAGGYVDGDTLSSLKLAGIDINKALRDNDAYHALLTVNGLIKTGPTGTNVNDLSVVLLNG